MGFFKDLGKMSAQKLALGTLNSGPVKAMINKKIAEYATFESFDLDDEKGLTIVITLLGEQERTAIRVGDLKFSDDDRAVIPSRLDTNKPWLRNLLKNFVDGKQFPLPEEAGIGVAVLKQLMG